MSEIVVSDRRTSTNGDRYRVTFSVSGGSADELYFDIPVEYKDWVTDSYDPAVAGLLIGAMSSGRNLRVEGAVSERLAWFVSRTVMPILQVVHDWAKPIEIVGYTATRDTHQVANAVAMGISGGVDSTSGLIDYGPDSNAPVDMRLTHLIFNEVGAAGRFGNDFATRLSEARRQNVRELARDVGLPLITMNSNVEAHQDRRRHGQTHDLKNACTPLLLQRGIRNFLYPAEWRWAEISFRGNSTADPMIVPALSTENVNMRSIGTEHSRQEKTRQISEYPIAEKHLDICTRDYPNCSACSKCIRAMMFLEHWGKLPKFAGQFDIERYNRTKLTWAVFARFGANEGSREAALMFRPQGLSQFTKYYSLLVLNRLDTAALSIIPGYRAFAGRGPARRLRRKLLFQV